MTNLKVCVRGEHHKADRRSEVLYMSAVRSAMMKSQIQTETTFGMDPPLKRVLEGRSPALMMPNTRYCGGDS